ncbi:cyclic nucleotide-binding domain protein (macronuclear) [Tetrahymena thermophila SB210]|uniref:Cyclic nucleotide-binding domain protein n=1 Tax=Tetrahymena thermophila (strain SB210) TaxID=312017 RepID=Q22MR1_TETTS|nr:cyclic nucleotide-binding domain protein [Tetrahymena thermophila SB210]EAR86557.2 cyclic nucleotide-binding domain protein [Tetrahymena thermophila SB210]|eukprot:XP_976959.2 cyclic nucleotide-binding domain protein [Tetrahymena thermophila SB210]
MDQINKQQNQNECCGEIFQSQQNDNQQNFQNTQLTEYDNVSSQQTPNRISQKSQQLLIGLNSLSNSAYKNIEQAFNRKNSPKFSLKIKHLRRVLRDEDNVKDSEQSFLTEHQSYQINQIEQKQKNDQQSSVQQQLNLQNNSEKYESVTNTPMSMYSGQVDQVSDKLTLKKIGFSDEFKTYEDYSKMRNANLRQNKQNKHHTVEIQRIQQLKQNLKNNNENKNSLQNKNNEQSPNSLLSDRNILDSKKINYFRDRIIKQSGQTIKKYPQVQPINEQNNEEEKKVQVYQNWRMISHLNIILKVKQKLLSMITQKIECVTPQQHYLIGDRSDIFNQNETKQKDNFLNQINSFILDPGSNFVIGSKILISVLILFNLIYFPIVFGFDLDVQLQITLITSLSVLFCILEIILGFKIAYYEMGELVTDPSQIRKKYMRDQFLLDLLACLSLLIGFQYKYVIILTFVKVKNLTQYLWDIDNHFFLYERFHTAWVLIKLFGFITIMGHYFACIFHYAAMIQNDDPNVVTWIQGLQLQDSPWNLRYNYSVYFSFITCITIGYGDITPKNVIERNVVIIISLISTGFFSYSINTIGTIFQQQFQNLQAKKEMRFDAIIYMRERHIHKHLQLRVLKYIDYINDMKQISPDRGLVVINQISKDLQSLLFKDFYGKILKQNKHFSLNYSSQTLEKLSLKMKEKIYGPGEIIFEQKEQDYKIFYLIKGEIEYYIHNKCGNKQSDYISVTKTDKSMFFGYKGFISGIPREMTCRSVNVTHVFYCSRDDLISVLKEDPQDYEQFCKIRDQYLLYTNSLGEQCFTCKKYGHSLSCCHKTHLVRNKELLIQKSNYSQNQCRASFERKKQKYQTFLNLQLTVFQGIKIRLKTIMKLRKRYISDQIIEQIIIQDLSTGTTYKNKYPSIQFRDKELILLECDEINEECSSQFLSDVSEDISINTNIAYQDTKKYQDNQKNTSQSNQQLQTTTHLK